MENNNNNNENQLELLNLLMREINIVNITHENENDENNESTKTSREFINSLKEIEKKEKDIICPICLDEIKIDEKCIELPCGNSHRFHSNNENCPGILNWFKKSNTCPTCRVEFPTETVNSSETANSSEIENNFEQPHNLFLRIIHGPRMNMNELIRREEERQLDQAIQASLINS